MGVAWFVAANRGDVLWAGGKADHQVHFGTHDDVIVLFTDWRIGFDGAIGFDRGVLPEIERRRQFDGLQAQFDRSGSSVAFLVFEVARSFAPQS